MFTVRWLYFTVLMFVYSSLQSGNISASGLCCLTRHSQLESCVQFTFITRKCIVAANKISVH